MENVKLYFESIGIGADEQAIMDFLNRQKDAIKSLWESQNVLPDENREQSESGEPEAEQSDIPQEEVQQAETVESPEEKPETQTAFNQTQTDMPKVFDSGERPDREKTGTDALALEIKNMQITFQNGKVNQEYSVDFDIETYKFRNTSIADVEFVELGAIGLHYFPDEKKIKGIPTTAGDHKITMLFKIRGYEDRSPLERSVVFIINPDPKSLWKNIPSEQDPAKIEYPKPDSDRAFLKVESKKTKGILGIGKKEIARKDMVAASQRGRSHAIEGKPRDDDFALYFDTETEWYVMIVADGAGSAPFSRRGSQIACQTATDICKVKITETGNLLEEQIKLYQDKKTGERKDVYEFLHQIVGKAAFEAYKKIREEAAEKQRKPKEYATTLLLTICKKFDFGWFVGAFWVGDGGIGIYRKETQELKILGEPDGGEFAGQTRFLTMPEIFSDRVRTRFEIVEDFTAVILMTDGVTDPKFETDANLNRIEKWNDLWDDLKGKNEDSLKVDFSDDSEQAAEQLLNWLDFWSKGNHDDRTIAILF
jgi:serine/threonine protein phosphatase PrpC